MDKQGWGFISKKSKNTLTYLEANRSKILEE